MNFISRLYFLNKGIYCFLIFLFVLSACTIVKKSQPNKPFVFENKVELKGNLSKDDRKLMLSELENYWADSLKARKVTKIFIKQLTHPPVFDTANITRSKYFMNAYLNSKGYYYASLKEKLDTTIFNSQQRISITMQIDLGKNIKIDSVSYSLADTINNTKKDSMLQNLAMMQFENNILKKGESYTKQKISDELDRLVSWFRENGYYKFTREHIYALVDTTNEKLLKLTLDPIELAKLIQEAEKKRKENPEWDIAIKQKVTSDSDRLNQFYINHIYFYPETKVTDIPDSLLVKKWKEVSNKKGDLTMRELKGKFVMRPLREHTILRKDSLYRENLFYKTINSLSKISSWQQIDARIIQVKPDSLDIHYFLIPQKKYQMNYNLEGSLNYGDFTAGNLLGLSLSGTLNNRNVWKQAIQSSTNARLGVELNILNKSDTSQSNGNLVQTLQFSLSQSYSIPRLIMPRSLRTWKTFRNAENKRTLISASIAHTERFEIFRLRTGIINWGYEGQQKNGNIYFWKPFNIELYKIDTLPGLDTLFKANPYLRNSFNDGNVVGLGLGSINFTKTKVSSRDKLNTHYLRLGFEESGLLTSFIKPLEDKIYRFIKLETEYKFNRKKLKTDLAYRFFAGIGIPLSGQSLPFFKQYFAGGPNSMRAWSIKQLGLGSSILSDTIPVTSYRDRFGDIQLETNLEYRFNLLNIAGYKIGSAIFADIGNVWNLKSDPTNANAELSLSHFYKDLAVGVGTGLRLDFTYFLIRVDFAYKVKDPGRNYNDGWMSIKNFTWKENRNNLNKTEIKNFAFQLGIGLPF